MIQIKDVSFAYANGLETLHNINLSAKKENVFFYAAKAAVEKQLLPS